VLYKKDFEKILAGRPEVRSAVEAVAARRIAENEAKAAS
jgi:monovalent cation:H+ antiporter, CPA1 family